MSKKPRYVVMIKGGKTLYRGNSRLLAWTIWLVNRRHKAIAYDCGIWVVEPAGNLNRLDHRGPSRCLYDMGSLFPRFPAVVFRHRERAAGR